MGGKEIISNLLEIDPNVKAIVASGYSDDQVMSDYKRYGFKGSISKPFQVKELINMLEKIS